MKTSDSKMNIVPVILCGGSGTRLWPLSREHYPKQLLSLAGEETLLQATISRVMKNNGAFSVKAPLIISNDVHRFQIAEQVRALDLTPASIMLEPAGRNTAPALAVAAQFVAQQADALMMVMPADHVIKDAKRFHDAVAHAAELARQDYLVTFGVVPTTPETGYGYIRKGGDINAHASAISQFVEKPDLSTAQKYLASGEYLWNSGMFLMKASVWLQALEAFRQDISAACEQSFKQGRADVDFFRLHEESFKACPSDSIDYAVMEKLTDAASRFKGAVVPLDAGWSDVGSWDSLWDVRDKNNDGNVLAGDVFLENTSNSMIMAEHRMVAALGLKDVIVVETPDAVLIADKKASQDVKAIVGRLKADGRDEALMHRRVFRPWGNYEGIDKGDRYQVKRIVVKPGASLSLQMHHHRAEHWIVVRGTAKVTRGEERFLLAENQSTYIPLGVTHRLENPGTIPLEIIEVQSGSYLGEDDIVRFDDVYGRKDGAGKG